MSAILPLAAATALVVGTGATAVQATEPCGDFGECKVLIEINSTDGDIGFHFLMDGDDLKSASLVDPNGVKVFADKAKGPLKEQKLTETFAESAEPLCWPDPAADPEDEIVTLEEFLERWEAGTYTLKGKGDGKSSGATELTHALPAAPSNLAFNGSVISWAAGTDLGKCGSTAELDTLVANGVLPVHPKDVTVAAWEIVFEPNVADGDPSSDLVLTVRVAGSVATKALTVPADYLASLPADTPAKVEVGAIGVNDNATFTEVGGFCVNQVAGCQ